MPIQTDKQSMSQQLFLRDGYLLVRGLATDFICQQLSNTITAMLNPLLGPAEFEVEVQYPGAPRTRLSRGANTPRRLLHAYGRHSLFRDWAHHNEMNQILGELMAGQQLYLVQSHHNCVMTKYPNYGSATNWHQDIRYWNYDKPDLISVWLALGAETERNGALKIIPASHKLALDRGCLDRDLFLRAELEENKKLIDAAVKLELQAGDVVFFHSRLFHAAGANHSEKLKTSLVYTFHGANNSPIPGTVSSQYPAILID